MIERVESFSLPTSSHDLGVQKMGLKRNPSRDNSIGKHSRQKENESLACSVNMCGQYRSGFSKYCKIHKAHIATTGSLEQEYIPSLKTTMKPYIHKVKSVLESKRTEYASEFSKAQTLLQNPQSLNNVDVVNNFRELSFPYGTLLSAKTIHQLKTLKMDEATLISSVIAVHIYQLEYPSKLNLGMPLFFHLGKLFHAFTKYKAKLSARGNKYYAHPNMTKNQYILLGMRLHILFEKIIGSFSKHYSNEQSKPIAETSHHSLHIRKTILEELLEEKEERIQFVKDQMKINPSITVDMANREIRSIVSHMDALIEEEKRSHGGS